MTANIFLKDRPFPYKVHGERLGSYEIGSVLHIKDYSKDSPDRIVATISLADFLFIEYILTKENSEIKDSSLENSGHETK